MHAFPSEDGSQLGKGCNASVVFSTRSVKDINVCRIRCRLSVQWFVSVLLQLGGAPRDEQLVRGTSCTRVPYFCLCFEEEAAFSFPQTDRKERPVVGVCSFSMTPDCSEP